MTPTRLEPGHPTKQNSLFSSRVPGHAGGFFQANESNLLRERTAPMSESGFCQGFRQGENSLRLVTMGARPLYKEWEKGPKSALGEGA